MYTPRHAVVVVLLGLLVLASPAASAASQDVESGILRVDVTGEGAAAVVDGDQYVWAGEPTAFRATIADIVDESGSYYETYVVRVTQRPDATYTGYGEESLAVGRITLAELAAGNVTLTVPARELDPGVHELYVSLYETGPGADQRVNETRVVVRAVWKHGDVDADKLSNVDEANGETSFVDADTDDDDLSDGNEVHVFESDPTVVDTDGDDLSDAREVRAGTNPRESDTDSDDIRDVPELRNASSPTAEDTDLDGLTDPVEAELGTDPRDRDTDGDGLSDDTEYWRTNTDPLAVDTDGDGLEDAAEVRRFDTNPRSADSDGDGVSDAREVLRGTDPTKVANEAADRSTDRADVGRASSNGATAESGASGRTRGVTADVRSVLDAVAWVPRALLELLWGAA